MHTMRSSTSLCSSRKRIGGMAAAGRLLPLVLPLLLPLLLPGAAAVTKVLRGWAGKKGAG